MTTQRQPLSSLSTQVYEYTWHLWCSSGTLLSSDLTRMLKIIFANNCSDIAWKVGRKGLKIAHQRLQGPITARNEFKSHEIFGTREFFWNFTFKNVKIRHYGWTIMSTYRFYLFSFTSKVGPNDTMAHLHEPKVGPWPRRPPPPCGRQWRESNMHTKAQGWRIRGFGGARAPPRYQKHPLKFKEKLHKTLCDTKIQHKYDDFSSNQGKSMKRTTKIRR